MTQVLLAKWIISVDEDKKVYEDCGIVFDTTIHEILPKEVLRKKYQKNQIQDLGSKSILMPGLINPHIHLEFSANKHTLEYGNFNKWLDSVITHREDLIQRATPKLIEKKLHEMILQGTTTIGAISSYGLDMQACANSKMNTVFFNEVIGSKAEMIDGLFADFQARLKSAQNMQSDNFHPAVAIHSPYSVHPFLLREALQVAKKHNYPVSAHFLESPAEMQWLKSSSGDFLTFFEKFLNISQSMTTADEFLEAFQGLDTLSFVHCVYANDSQLDTIRQLDASIIHCPKSNRLLSNDILDISKTPDNLLALGTDGLSSNNSLHLFDEIQGALFMHAHMPLHELANTLIHASTQGGAKALGLSNKGRLQKGKDADILALELDEELEDVHSILLHVALHKPNISQVYIKGSKCVQ